MWCVRVGLPFCPAGIEGLKALRDGFGEGGEVLCVYLYHPARQRRVPQVPYDERDDGARGDDDEDLGHDAEILRSTSRSVLV